MSRTNHPRGWVPALTREIGPWLSKTAENKRLLRRRARRQRNRDVEG